MPEHSRRRLRSVPEKVEEENRGGSPASPSSSSSSSSSQTRNASLVGKYNLHPRRRRADEVEKISQTECLFTTSLGTEYGGSTFVAGNMFTVVPSSVVEVLTLEFDAQIRAASDLATKVYYKEGDFSGATSDAAQWTLLADTTARAAPGGEGAIIPAGAFTRVTLDAGSQYSFYLHIQGGNDIMKLKTSDKLIGEEFFTDGLGLLALQVGVSLSEGPFPSTFTGPAEFSGRIHYKSTQECDSVRTTSFVELEFAVNENPEENVMQDLSEAVQKAIDAVIILDPDLIKFDKFHSLEIVNVESSFMGRSEEKCPTEFDTCSLVTSRVQFLHLPTITSGELWLKILKNDVRIAESVIAQSDVETQYVGYPVIQMDFIITLSGVPDGTRMNTLQRRYFEIVTAGFLASVTGEVPIYTTAIVDEVATGDTEAGRRRSLQSLRLRGSYIRQLEGEGGLQVVTTISGSGSNPGDIRAAVLEAIGLQSEQYIQELVGQQLRPGEINDGNSGDMFAKLTAASIAVKPDNFGAEPAKPAGSSMTEEDAKKENVVWLWLCSLGVVVALVWLGYRVYRDFFFAPSEEKKKLTGDDHFEANRSRRPSFEGRRPPRSLSLDRLPMKPRSMDGLSSQSAHIPGSKPDRPRSLADLMPHSAHIPRNTAGENGRGLKPNKSMPMNLMLKPSPKTKTDSDEGDTNAPSEGTPKNRAGLSRGIKPTKSLPEMLRPQNLDDRSVSNTSRHSTRSTPASKATTQPVNRAGQSRGIKPIKSLPELLRPQNLDDRSVSNTSKHSTRSAPAMKHHPQNKAGQNRGLRANNSMPATRRSVSPSSRSLPGIPTKKHPPKKQVSELSNSSTHSVRSVPNLTMKKHPPKSQTAEGLSNASGHSLRSVPNLKASKNPPKKAPANGLSSASGHSVRSLPNLTLKKHPPKSQAPEGLSNASGHSISSVPNLTGKKHLPKNQAGKRRGVQPSRSLPALKRPAPGGKGAFQNSSLDDWASSEESDSQSSEESDFDDSAPTKPFSSKKNVLPCKSQSMPEDSESSEESDLEDFVLNLVSKEDSGKIDTKFQGSGDQTSAPTEILTDEESSIEEKNPVEKTPTKKTKEKKEKKKKEKKEKKEKKKKKEKKEKNAEKKASKKAKKKSSCVSLGKVPKSTDGVRSEEKSPKKEIEDQPGNIHGMSASRSLPDTSKELVTLRDMVKKDASEESSSSSESEEENTRRDGPPSTIVQKSNSDTTDIPDDVSEVSSITASFHSSKLRKAELRREPEGRLAALAPSPHSISASTTREKRLAKIRNHLRDVSTQPVDLSSSIMRPAHLRDVDEEFDELSTPKSLPRAKVDPQKELEGKTRKPLPKANTQKELEGKTPPGSLPKVRIPRTRSGDFGAVGKIKLLRTRSGEFGMASRQSESSGTGSVVSVTSHHSHTKSWQDLVKKVDTSKASPTPLARREPVRGEIRRIKSDERLKPVSLSGGSNREGSGNGLNARFREPVRGELRRTRSDERLVPIILSSDLRSKLSADLRSREAKPAALPVRGQLQRAQSDERRGTIAAHLSSILGDEEGLN